MIYKVSKFEVKYRLNIYKCGKYVTFWVGPNKKLLRRYASTYCRRYYPKGTVLMFELEDKRTGEYYEESYVVKSQLF